jgi:hypothetical protein
VVAFAPRARASSPLEYPDNGSAAFSRGGAWLAVGNEPIAAHYDPAALAIQASGASVEQQLGFPHTCYDRRGPGDAIVGPNDGFSYREACSQRGSFPNTIPSVSLAWRVAPRLGVGIAIVPPATYGVAEGQFPILARGAVTSTGVPASVPAPYRYMQLEQRSTILFPTAAVGYEIAPRFRIGAGFVSGIAFINTSTMGVANLTGSDAAGDHMMDDALSVLRTRDLLVPGVVLSMHWSVLDDLDVALWGRWMDSIRANDGSLDLTQQVFDANGGLQPSCAGSRGTGGQVQYGTCPGSTSVPNHFAHAVTRFEYPIPPEIRWGVRFHAPRARSRMLFGDHGPARDPLRDDVFDVELDQSLTLNSFADTIVVRFKEQDGKGALVTAPTFVPVPPNADRATGYRDSYGVRLGGQWNAVPGLFGVRAGGWLETRAVDPRFLTVYPFAGTRWGVGGGIVARYGFLDASVGYQRQMAVDLDNHGNGGMKAPAATSPGTPFDLHDEKARNAADRTQFRTEHAVNGGRLTFDADVFTLGLTARFE